MDTIPNVCDPEQTHPEWTHPNWTQFRKVKILIGQHIERTHTKWTRSQMDIIQNEQDPDSTEILMCTSVRIVT